MKEKFMLIYSLSLLITFSSFGAAVEYPNHFDSSFGNSITQREITNQFEQCGIDAVYMCLQYFDKNIPLLDVAKKVPSEVVNRGMSMAELQELLSAFSLESVIISGRPELIDHWLEEKCIVILPNAAKKHFFIYLGKRGQEYLRYNPPYWKVWASFEDLKSDWEGKAVVVSDVKIATEGPGITRSIFAFTPATYVFLTASIGFVILGFWFKRSSRK